MRFSCAQSVCGQIWSCTCYTLSSAHPGTLPSFWLQLHPRAQHTQDFGPGYVLICSPFPTCASNLHVFISFFDSIFQGTQSGNGKANPGLVRRSKCNQKTAITLNFKVSSTWAYTNHFSEEAFWIEERQSKKLLKNVHAPNIIHFNVHLTILHQC